MNRFILTTASAALLATASVLPAQAESHDDISSMTCADFRAMDDDRQMEVAALAFAELEGGGESMLDTARATEPVGGDTTEEEVNEPAAGGTIVDNDGEARATDGSHGTGDGSGVSDFEMLQASCDRNMEASLLDAAAGMDTPR